MSVRAASLADAEAIGIVNLAAWRETYAGLVDAELLDSLALDALVARWQSHLSAEDALYTIVVAESDVGVVGYAASGPPRDEAAPRPRELYSIYLLASSQGEGLGRALLQAAVGDEPAHLWVASANESAQAFYRRNGFEADGAPEVAIAEFGGLLSRRMIR